MTDAVREACALLGAGEIVALPTETVYGLGADALNPEAVAKVFAAKERPSFDPLIVHIASRGDLKNVAIVPDDIAETVLRARGEVVVVPAERMPGECGMAAILRY